MKAMSAGMMSCSCQSKLGAIGRQDPIASRHGKTCKHVFHSQV